MDRTQLADFLRRRREALQPEDVGLVKGPRRRTSGLRREEVAALCGMSVDYYGRLEQERGPQPSEQMLAAIARGLRLSLDERDHLFRLAGHQAPARTLRSDHVNPAMMRVLDRLDDTPAQVMTDLGETLVQNRLAVALLGDQTHFTGPARAMVYRWFTDPLARMIYPDADHDKHGRIFVSGLRTTLNSGGGNAKKAAAIAARLQASSPEFGTLWSEHEVGRRFDDQKIIAHAEVGLIELHCQVLLAPDEGQAMLIFTATPGSDSYDRLVLLSVIGVQALSA